MPLSHAVVWAVCVEQLSGSPVSYPQRVVQGLGRTLAEVELVSDLLVLLADLGVYAVRPLLLSLRLCFLCVLWSPGLSLDEHTHTHG